MLFPSLASQCQPASAAAAKPRFQVQSSINWEHLNPCESQNANHRPSPLGLSMLCLSHVSLHAQPDCPGAQLAKAQMDTISTQLERFTGFDDEMRHLEMQQEMVAKQLAAMQTRLEVRCPVRAALTLLLGLFSVV